MGWLTDYWYGVVTVIGLAVTIIRSVLKRANADSLPSPSLLRRGIRYGIQVSDYEHWKLKAEYEEAMRAEAEAEIHQLRSLLVICHDLLDGSKSTSTAPKATPIQRQP